MVQAESGSRSRAERLFPLSQQQPHGNNSIKYYFKLSARKFFHAKETFLGLRVHRTSLNSVFDRVNIIWKQNVCWLSFIFWKKYNLKCIAHNLFFIRIIFQWKLTNMRSETLEISAIVVTLMDVESICTSNRLMVCWVCGWLSLTDWFLRPKFRPAPQSGVTGANEILCWDEVAKTRKSLSISAR